MVDNIKDIFDRVCKENISENIKTENISNIFYVDTNKLYIGSATIDGIESNIFKLSSICIFNEKLRLSFLLR